MTFQKGQSGNPGGRNSKERIFRDALLLAIKRPFTDKETGEEKKYLNKIAEKLIELAGAGNMNAIQEIANRLDGRSVIYSDNTSDVTHHNEVVELTEDERDQADAKWVHQLLLGEVKRKKSKAQKSKMN